MAAAAAGAQRSSLDAGDAFCGTGYSREEAGTDAIDFAARQMMPAVDINSRK